MSAEALQNFVVEAGRRLERPPDEVEPYVKILTDNWYDSPESLADTRPEELANQGIPLRFAKELVSFAAAQKHGGSRSGGGGSGRSGGKKGPGKGKARGEGGKGKGDGKHEQGYAREAMPASGEVEFKQRIDLWEHDGNFNLMGAIIGEKGKNVHHIQDQTGAAILVQGNRGEAMWIEIRAPSSRDLNRAVTLTEDLLGAVHSEYEAWVANGRHERVDRPPLDNWGDGGKGKQPEKGKGKGKGKRKGKDEQGRGDGYWKEILDLWDCDHAFGLRDKIVGERARNVHHIQDQTGAKVWCGGDPLKVEVSANSSDILAKAIQMSQDLIGTVYDEFLKFTGGDGHRGKGRNRGKGGKGKDKDKDSGKGRSRRDEKGGKGGGENDFVKIIKLKDTEPGFQIRGALIGNGGRNVHHIQDQTGAKIWFHGESLGQNMRLEVSAPSAEQLDQAVNMSKDLIKTVYKSFEEWQRSEGSDKDRNMGKGRGSRREYDDEPPPKRSRHA
mmetsp:Transcript_128019/g.249456  ORF Transcript_128019/g.249456 Transcript_128019/m.249456 type:complete len:498 (-) Transcript_128019:122-1615(-)